MNRYNIAYVYLWLLPILSVPGLYVIRNNTSQGIYLFVVALHLGLLAACFYQFRAYSFTKKKKNATTAACLLLLGATCTFISATTFPTTELKAISADKFGHYWTSAGFFISQILFLSGITLLNNIIETKKERTHKVGYLLMLAGGALWLVHLAFRLSIMVQSAEQLALTGEIPESYELMALWAGSLYVSYMVLTYLGFIAYGLALIKMEILPKWLAKATFAFGIAAPILFAIGIGPFRMPITIQVAPWAIGIYLIKGLEIGKGSRLQSRLGDV